MIATKATAQVLGHFLKVAYFAQFLMTDAAEVAPMAVVLAVALALVGTQLSRRVLDAISDAQFRRWSRGLIAAVAALYLIQGLSLFIYDLAGATTASASTASPVETIDPPLSGLDD